MTDEQEKKICELEEKVEKTNERINICIGAGIAMVAAMTAGSAFPVFMLVVVTGGGIGSGIHHTRKWLKNRKNKNG